MSAPTPVAPAVRSIRPEYEPRPLLPGSGRCRCGRCGCHFTSASAFDEHRMGRPGTRERRCLTADEMDARGMRVTSDRCRTTSKPSGYGSASPLEAAIDDDPSPEAA